MAALAKTMIDHTPMPAQVRDCTASDLVGGATLTYPTASKLGGLTLPDVPEMADWINPSELDSPAARTLLTASATLTDRRRAAAELLAAPFYLVYKVDQVAAPIALGVKELKQGLVNARAVRYDHSGRLVCSLVFHYYQDDAKQAWAVDKSDALEIDPAVAQAMRDDLRYQMLRTVASLGDPHRVVKTKGMPPKPPGP